MRMAVKTFEQGGFVRDFCIDRIGKDNRGFFAGIVIPAINGKAVQFFFGDGKAVEDGFFEFPIRMIDGKSDFS